MHFEVNRVSALCIQYTYYNSIIYGVILRRFIRYTRHTHI